MTADLHHGPDDNDAPATRRPHHLEVQAQRRGTTPTATHEVAKAIARARKAKRLALAAHQHHLRAEQVATDPEIRDRLVKLTGVRAPSAATWAAAVGAMEVVAELLQEWTTSGPGHQEPHDGLRLYPCTSVRLHIARQCNRLLRMMSPTDTAAELTEWAESLLTSHRSGPDYNRGIVTAANDALYAIGKADYDGARYWLLRASDEALALETAHAARRPPEPPGGWALDNHIYQTNEDRRSGYDLLPAVDDA